MQSCGMMQWHNILRDFIKHTKLHHLWLLWECEPVKSQQNDAIILDISKILCIFIILNSITADQPTDRLTDGQTDKASYRDAWTHLKILLFIEDGWARRVFIYHIFCVFLYTANLCVAHFTTRIFTPTLAVFCASLFRCSFIHSLSVFKMCFQHAFIFITVC